MGVLNDTFNPRGTNLNSDQPIASADEDRFSRVDFARRIADLVIQRTEPTNLVISINAPWGAGKSSVLAMIEERLVEREITTLSFNPWRYPDEDTLLKNFFIAVAKKLKFRLETKWESGFTFLRKNVGVASVTKVIGFDGKEIATGLINLAPNPAIDELNDRIIRELKNQQKKIVILMDDIDRLDVEEIHAVFRLIKLTANFPNTSYVLAFDNDRVSQALATKYVDSPTSGFNFLEKIVQVSLQLPPASPKALIAMTQDGINEAIDIAQIEVEKYDESRVSDFFEKAFRSRITTPRLSKRFTNSLKFSLPLLKDEVNVADSIFLEGIKAFYPKLYSALQQYGDLILESTVGTDVWSKPNASIREDVRKLLLESISDIPTHMRGGIESLLHSLIPGIFNIEIKRESGVDLSYESKLKSKHFCTREYYWQYFSYGTPREDLSEKSVIRFLELIE